MRCCSRPLAAAAALLTCVLAPKLASAANTITFTLTDEPGRWFKSQAGPIAGTHSLAVATPGVTVNFVGGSHTVHTMSSLIFPSSAPGMPFDTEATKGRRSVTLTTPGLYVFVCKIHPYMLGAVIVDDPATAGLDLGEAVSLFHGPTVPTSSDLATRLLRAFFIITNPRQLARLQQAGRPGTSPIPAWTCASPGEQWPI